MKTEADERVESARHNIQAAVVDLAAVVTEKCCHREDGPAIEWPNGIKYWYKNGQYIRTKRTS